MLDLRHSFAALSICALAGALGARPQVPPPKEEPAAKREDAPRETPRPFALMVGDRAPALAAGAWVKGRPVDGFEPGKVYVVEFWATWCVPCIASMPHLSELQDRFADKGLVVVGVTSADTRGNTLEAVTRMVEAKGEVMRYRVAFDPERAVNDAWMIAAGRTSIPSSFVVDKQGRVAFIGHPNEMDTTLNAVIADTFDLEAAAERYLDEQAAERRRLQLHARVRLIQMRIAAASENKEWATVLAGYDEILALDPAFADYAVHKFNVMLSTLHDYDAAYAFALEAASTYIANDGTALVRMALGILDGRDLEVRDVPIALSLAMQADDLGGGKDALAADTLAKAFFQLEDLESAVEAQRRAVAAATPVTLERYRIPLQRYEALLEEQRRREREGTK